MNGNYIKINHTILRSPAVACVMTQCKTDYLHALGAIISGLMLFNEQSKNGYLSGYTVKAFDDLIGLPGLADALCDPRVGWMKVNEDGLTLLDKKTKGAKLWSISE